MEHDRPVREVLRDWLYSMVESADLPGCLVINTATELGTDDPETARRVDAAFNSTTAAIASLLRRGITTGELPADLDADATADLLFTILTGLGAPPRRPRPAGPARGGRPGAARARLNAVSRPPLAPVLHTA